MDIQRCFEILELDRDASPDEVKQAYKDIVNVWHPDRFSNNPRLKQKAEKKLKEVNMAYEMVKSFLSSNHERDQGQKKATPAKAGPGYNDAGARDKTEVAVEAGTRLFLNACSYLYTILRRLAVNQVRKVEAEEKAEVEPVAPNERRSQSRGSRRGKGRGMDRGKRGS